jgi:NAD(P)-dependent dehydrogenase (short-subunit alcohol dehydrogenase family)
MGTSLEGKIAVVTGGSAGIGLAVAHRFIEEGALVYITGRRTDELAKARAELGRQVETVQGDIAHLEDLDRLYETIRADKGRVDIVVANAGVVEVIALEDISPENFDTAFNINARGSFFTVQKALPLMADGGSIVMMSSGMKVKGFPGYGVYSATKSAVRSFVRTWAAELKDRGIRVNAVSPGGTETPILRGQFGSEAEFLAGKDSFKSIIPMGRLARPAEIANAVYYLASDQGSFTTGFDLVVDGGAAEL